EAEIELRRAIERVAAQRRALPPGGPVPDDYRFEEVADSGREVRFSELFEAGKDTLVVYSFMFPRWSGDTRPGPADGETARRPLVNVSVRAGARFRHSWATELIFAPRDEGEDPRHVDSIWPIWSVLDMTPEGRGTASDFPKLQ